MLKFLLFFSTLAAPLGWVAASKMLFDLNEPYCAWCSEPFIKFYFRAMPLFCRVPTCAADLFCRSFVLSSSLYPALLPLLTKNLLNISTLLLIYELSGLNWLFLVSLPLIDIYSAASYYALCENELLLNYGDKRAVFVSIVLYVMLNPWLDVYYAW